MFFITLAVMTVLCLAFPITRSYGSSAPLCSSTFFRTQP